MTATAQFAPISSLAAVHPDAKLGKNVTIGPFVTIYPGAELGDNVSIEPGTVIYENVILGDNTHVGAQCILGERLGGRKVDASYVNPKLSIGANSVIRAGTIIYAGCSMGEGFQTGSRAIIREESHFGKSCSFGALAQCDGQVKIGDNCRFHNNVFIATFTTIEDNVHFYPMSCTVDSLHPPCQKGREGPYLEEGVIVGAKVLILPRVRVGAGAILAGASVVTHDVKPNVVVAGAPAKAIRNKADVRCHLEDRPAYEVALENTFGAKTNTN
ncbi:MAG TPA: DapH/DapD/GlmU-related protein [Oculatellaceae cyanobacterium]